MKEYVKKKKLDKSASHDPMDIGKVECHEHEHRGCWDDKVDSDGDWCMSVVSSGYENDVDAVNKGKGKGKAKGEGRFEGECYNCGEYGHSARFCPLSSKGKSKGKGPVQRYNCGQLGHIAAQCLAHPIIKDGPPILLSRIGGRKAQKELKKSEQLPTGQSDP